MVFFAKTCCHFRQQMKAQQSHLIAIIKPFLKSPTIRGSIICGGIGFNRLKACNYVVISLLATFQYIIMMTGLLRWVVQA